MIHGPCGVINPYLSCMDGSLCTKHYPKPFTNDTTIEENGFVRYRRTDDGRMVVIMLTIDGLFFIIVICV